MELLENVEYRGKSLIVTKSSQSSTGYKNVIKLRTDKEGPIYVAKFKVEGETGQRNCPKSYSRSPQESAAALAYFEAGYLGAMPNKKEYAVHRTAQVCALASAFVLCVFSHLCLLRVPQEVARAKEERARVKEERKAEKAEKAAEARRLAEQRQASTGLKKHKREPSIAGTPLVAIAWEPMGAWPSALPTVVAEPIPVAIEPMPPHNPNALA